MRGASRGDLPNKILTSTVVTFAVWTLAVQGMVAFGGNLYHLLITFAITGIVTLLGIRRLPAPSPSPSPPRDLETGIEPGIEGQDRLFWLIVAAILVLTLVSHRPDPDDTYYLNLAVSAADNPTQPILQNEDQHLLPWEVQIKRAKRLVSFSMVPAAVTLTTGIPSIAVFHLVLPLLAALLVLLAYRQLFQILAPRWWALGVLAVVVFLIADGATHRSYGNFSFVRLHQGKAVLVTLFVPLLIAWGLRFAQRPSWRRGLLLAAGQVAAVGASSTGLLVAPVVSGLAVLTGSLGLEAGAMLHRLGGACASSVYVALLALWARQPHLELALGYVPGEIAKREIDLGEKSDLVFGTGAWSWGLLFILLTAWFWCATPIARRLCWVFPTAVGLLFLTPLTVPALGQYVIPEAVYWRAFWLLPLPVMVALTLLAPLTKPWVGASRGARTAIFAGLTLLTLIASPIWTVAPRNNVDIRMPGLEVSRAYPVSQRVAELVGDRSVVLAPELVSQWLPTLHHHPYPVVSRLFYANPSRFRGELESRLALMEFVTGSSDQPMPPALFASELQRYDVKCVVILRQNRWLVELRKALRKAGFERRETLRRYQIWLPKAGHG